MKCVVCKQAETEPSLVTVTLERDSLTLVVKNVPAEVCVNCGEEYVDQVTARRILRSAETVARKGIQVEIRQYLAA
jgi:YgiT-type zinc finger domain-containing protein